MDRWNRWNQTPFEQPLGLEEPMSGGEGHQEEGEQPEEPDLTLSSPPQTPTEPQTPFSHPSLAGKTESEIAELLALSNSTIAAQRRRLTELENSPAQTPIPDEPSVPIDPQEFFSKPGETIQGIIQKELKAAVAPLLGDIVARREDSVWSRMRDQYPNFGTYEEAVREQLRAWGIPREQYSEDIIRTTYLSKVGEAAMAGSFNAPTPPNPSPTPSQGEPRINPQHRPSSHPPRQAEEPAKRKLTEEEKRFARIQFRGSSNPEEEYIKWTNEEARINDDGAMVMEE